MEKIMGHALKYNLQLFRRYYLEKLFLKEDDICLGIRIKVDKSVGIK